MTTQDKTREYFETLDLIHGEDERIVHILFDRNTITASTMLRICDLISPFRLFARVKMDKILREANEETKHIDEALNKALTSRSNLCNKLIALKNEIENHTGDENHD